MPSPTDFNVSPYYDDFTESKKFHRILFRPAFAVQARELTQSQTQIQNQIERLSDHLFDKGAMVIPGEIGYDLKYYAVKLTSKSNSTISDYIGKTLTGGTSGVTAKVVNAIATDGTDPDTLFVKYFNTNTTDNTTIAFSDGETITASSGDTAVVNTTATGSAAQIQQGVYYINGFHVQVSAQTLILDKYSNTPSYRVGLTVTESFVTPGDDTSLNDNAQGVSNTNAPGAHRFKIELTLAKKPLTSTEDNNFYELLRLSSGTLQNQVRTTEYAVLEDTLARRTYDESGDYVVKPFDIDVREHLALGNNRGIYTSANGGDTTKLAVGFSPGKAYVKGYEIDTIATTYIDVDKARDFDTQNNFSTRFDIGNYINVTNVYGSPDIASASGVEAFKGLTLHNEATSSRGSANSGSDSSITTIGRAKTRGFEYAAGTASANIFASSSLTSAVYKHYLFDIVLFKHLNITTAQSFTTGETVTGGSSGATGVVQEYSSTESATITGITQASPAVVTANNSFKEGQQVSIASVSGMIEVNGNVYTVRNPSSTTFELYDTDGTTAIDSSGYTAYTSGGTASHGIVVVSNVQGDFTTGETITGGTSSNTAVIQSNAVGLKGVASFDLPSVKQIAMAGSPTFTADTTLDATYGDNFILTGSIDVGSGSADVQGINTRFTEELKVGDSISFTNDSGNTETKIVEAIISDSSLTLSSVTAAASTKTILTRRRAKSQSPEKNVSIFKLPYTNIKTLRTTANSNASDTSYTFRKHEIKTLTGDGIGTFTAGVDETFADLSESDFTISIVGLGSGSSGAVGDVLSLTGNNHEGSAIFSLNVAKTQLTIDFGANYASHDVKALLTINKSVGTSKGKTLNSNETLAVSTQATIESGTIALGKADVYQINAIYMSSGFGTAATVSDTNITSRFDLDNGQRDNFYDIGRIKLKSGEVTPTGQLLIDFDYFTHSSGDYFDVDSYSGVINYEDIPSYTSSTTGVRYELRDSLDFRPRVDDASTIDSGVQDRSFDGSGASVVQPIKFNSDVRSDFEYYLGRVDKIFLDKDGNFKVLKGASSSSPRVPGELDNAMHLYTLYLPAYTLDTSEVGIEHVDNKRYTMRDIGRIESRIDTVEYYTQLSLLETAAQNLQIQDADGFDRFKNGFVVDNFTGHNIGDVGNRDYKVSIDYANGEMRPTFHEDAVKLIESDDDGTEIIATDRANANYTKTGDLITLPYVEQTLIDQPYASKAINVNPFGIFTWIGAIELTPPGDEWKETERAPELVINNPNGSWDNLTKQTGNSGQLSEFPMSTVWNSWQDTWTGRPVETERRRVGDTYKKRGGHGWRVIAKEEVTTAQQVSQTRTGIRAVAIPETVRTSIGDRVVSVAFVPFIRSRTITFNATRLKPNTRVYPFFDNIDITSYVTPDGGSLGGNLITDANGSVTGTFAIPDPKIDANPRWRTGQRLFRLTSSSTNSQTNSDVETAANAEYIARGLLETVRETILSSREARVEMRSVTENQSITRTSTRTTERQVGYHDPLAQTFLIDDEGGVFLTSIDIFFQTKDSSIPVTVQIRDVVNGYPGQKILPFSEVTLNPDSVNTSVDGTAATKFTFSSPVYIQNNVEYCFVVMANSQEYNAYVARIGETSLDSNRTISSQPYAGVMFKSQNGMTWSAEQNEDMKFKLRRAEFEQVTGTVTLTNDTLPSRTLKNNPLRTTNGSGVIRVFHPNHGMHGTNNKVTIAGVPSGSFNGIDTSIDPINGTYTSISNITLDSYDITTTGTATATGDIGGAAVTATQNRLFDVLNLGGIQTMTVAGTNIDYFVRTTTGKSIHGSESEFALTTAANKVAVINNDNIAFTAPQMVASEINESGDTALAIAANVGGKSLFTTLEMTTTNTKISPVLDTQRMSVFTISNRLNSPTTSNTPEFVDDIVNTGTSSAAVYCTKPVILENNSKALDIRLTANIRATSEVEMYYRVSGPDEERQLDDISWTPFNTDGSPDASITPAEDDTTFREYKYSATDIHDFTSFQLKIVMKGTNSSYPPILRDMRGIALAI